VVFHSKSLSHLCNLGSKSLAAITDLDFASFQGYKILLKAAIASGTVDSYVEKFLLEDRIDFKRLPADRLAKIKWYLEMFSEL